MVPYYFERTGMTGGFESVLGAFVSSRDAWLETLGDCMSYAVGLAGVKKPEVGLIGFSMLDGRRALETTAPDLGSDSKCGEEHTVPCVVRVSERFAFRPTTTAAESL